MKYLIAVDLSEFSVKAVEFGVKVAKEDDEITFISVFDPQSSAVEDPDLHKEKIKNYLEKMKEKFKDREVTITILIKEGSPREEICKAVDIVGADILIIGSRGVTGLKRMIMGSTSEHCLQNARCNVLIVK